MSTAVGVFFYSRETKRYLYLLRNDTNNWSIPGGKLEEDETLFIGLERECREEIGHFPDNAKLIPIQKFVNNNFTYHTFFCAVETEFSPELNDEHCGYAWVEEARYPKPLHNGLFNTINIDNVQEKLSILTEKSCV
jgi:8-oxo-dGTP pyrophosphatase MutT (NUDIX family)